MPRRGENRDPRRHEPSLEELLSRAGSTADRERLLRSLRRDPARAAEADEIDRLLARFRETDETPDLTQAVLSRVHRRRRFLPAPLRRVVTAGRVVVALALAATAGLIVLVERHVPEGVAPPEAAPVSDLVSASRSELGANVQSAIEVAQRALRAAEEQPESPRPWRLSLEGGPTMERTFRFEVDLEAAPAASPRRQMIAAYARDAFGPSSTFDGGLGVDLSTQAKVIGSSPRMTGLPVLLLPTQREAPAPRPPLLGAEQTPDVP